MKTFNSPKTYILSFLFCTLLSFSSFAQVGIGNTNPNTNSLLEVGDGTDTGGVLLPRVSLTATTSPAPLATDVAGMIVYNTNSNGTGATAVSPGFYYNDGTDWIRLGDEGDDWRLTGNAGTTPGTNYVGTSDAQNLILATGGTAALTVSTTQRLLANNNGSNGAPTYSFNSDSNIGMWKSGDDILNFSAGGREFIELFEGANDELRINDSGVDIDFRIESDNLTHMIFMDAANDAVGIGTSSPSSYGGVAVDRFSIVGGGTSTVVGPSTNYTPVSAIINEDEGVALFVYNESTTDTGAAIETAVAGPGYGIRALHLPASGAGYGVFGSTNSTHASGAWAGYFSGDILASNYWVPSEKKWKKNIKKLNSTENILDKLMLLNAKSYQWKTEEFPGMNFDDGITSFGFIAQELKSVFPELVSTSSIPDPTIPIQKNYSAKFIEGYHHVNYIGLIPVLTQAIQEQQEIIEEQNNRIELLEKAIEEIKNKLD